jgi:hypothetical protein
MTFDKIKGLEQVYKGAIGKWYHGRWYPKPNKKELLDPKKRIIEKDPPKPASDVMKQEAPKHDGKEYPRKDDKKKGF